jgi:acetyl-CoA carboxylase biotin carboxylase subunit
VIACDDTRDDCIARARRVLHELEVTGVSTTREIALEILDSEEFRSGDYSTSFLDEVRLAALA